MFNFESLSLSFAYSGYIFFLVMLVIAAYSWYVYRYTVPLVNPGKKILLTSLRTLALILMVFIIFEPIVTVAKKNILEPVIMVYTDNSRSINFKDGTNRADAAKTIMNDYHGSSAADNSEFFSFGHNIQSVNADSLGRLNFSESSTNFANIFSDLTKISGNGDNNKNISSVVIISDGVITEGSNPLFAAEKLNVPVYTIGIGDTAHRNDIELRNVLYNEFIYAETPTTINVSVSGKGFEGKQVTISLMENSSLIEQANVTITNDIQNVNFNYTPKTGGEKKLSVVVSEQAGEFSKLNNRKTFFINVLSNKIKTLILAGAPSSDVTFIKNSLKADPNLTVNSITQVAANKFLENNNRDKLIDSADILYLIGFPSKETPSDMLQKVKRSISSSNKPFFIVLSDGIDFNKLKELQSELPFSIGRINPGYAEVQPDISGDKSKNPLLQNNTDNPVTAWNNLPPVLLQNSILEAKPESEVLSRVKINNIPLNKPLIVSRRLGSKRSVAVLSKDIWRWKLQTTAKNLNLFDNFILQGVKWLNSSDEQKRVSIKTSKKLYSPGEDVEFSAQVYDESFNPVEDAEVKINISSGADKYEINLNAIGNGLYEGTFPANKTGDYFFNGSALQNGKKLGSDNGRFNVGEIDIEMLNPRQDADFLSLLSKRTNGRYFNVNNYKQLFDILKQRNDMAARENISVSEIDLWSNEWLMAIIIFLFAAEWFIRKRSGML